MVVDPEKEAAMTDETARGAGPGEGDAGAGRRASAVVSWALLIFTGVLSGTMLIPAVRPLFAARAGAAEGAMHAFMTLNLLGAVVGAPLLARWADRRRAGVGVVAALAFGDGVLLLACATPLPIPALLALRFVQGALNVGALSILMGLAPRGGAQAHNRSYGVAGAAMMAGVAAGPPLGTALLVTSPVGPLVVGGVLELLAAVAVLRLAVAPRAAAPAAASSALLRAEPLLRLPALWAFVERFGVGCFVVTFALHCHQARGLGDAQIGRLYGWFLIPFVLAMYPASRLGPRAGRAPVVLGGLVAYGVAYLLIGTASTRVLPLVLALAGVASSAVYAPALCLAATLAPAARRAGAMAMLNASGALGMMVGTAVAGIASAVLRRAGLGASAYVTVLACAGVAQFVAAAASVPALVRMRELDRAAPAGAALAGAGRAP
jgi:AAHS family 3-hydroxyphenylpropionic acid transporter